jgi:hypothetical protein
VRGIFETVTRDLHRQWYVIEVNQTQEMKWKS